MDWFTPGFSFNIGSVLIGQGVSKMEDVDAACVGVTHYTSSQPLHSQKGNKKQS